MNDDNDGDLLGIQEAEESDEANMAQICEINGRRDCPKAVVISGAADGEDSDASDDGEDDDPN